MKEKNTQTLIIAVLAVAVLVMAVGFAAYSANLSVDGTTTLKAAIWDVHFVTGDSDQGHYAETTGSNYVEGTSHSVTGTNVTYAATLTTPGEKHEFTIDVVNEGTFDAKLTQLSFTPTLTGDALNNLKVTINYGGTDYTVANGTTFVGSFTPNVQLDKQSGSTPGRKTLKVTTEYLKVDSDENLLDEDLPVTFNIALHYESIDSTATTTSS